MYKNNVYIVFHSIKNQNKISYNYNLRYYNKNQQLTLKCLRINFKIKYNSQKIKICKTNKKITQNGH